ncbi:MAG: Re/Si-specific NAD(P)(+) transhydrogenase subunit alpha [Planctomycetota bacterium]|nr:Re/Si-specific NAD(P)(+) transhydrogenase subunit alpha [Planctomycetota bacterium]
MRIGVLKETREGETRVALVPDAVPKLLKLGVEVLVEPGAGVASGFLDAAYEAKGAQVSGDASSAEVVLGVQAPDPARLQAGQVVASTMNPLGEPAGVAALAERGVTGIALELVPRISRAQAMDVLSSMANVAGYKAVLMAATASPKLFPLMMTAAGTVRPAKVFILGAGVAGLQAIATARRLGAVVEAYDIRSDTKEQVESLGARFVEFDLGVGDQQDSGGYAKELSEEQKALQARLMAEVIQAADAVITTAQVPGRRAPRLITEEVVEGMKPGAVVVDMAADSGGNCAYSKPGEEVVVNGVTILGPSNLPASVGSTTSQLFAQNLVALLGLIVQEGALTIDLEDEILAGAVVCKDGTIVQPRVQEALGAQQETQS